MVRLLRGAETALVPLLVVIGVVQAAQQTRPAAMAEVGWVLLACLPLLLRHRRPATASIVVTLALLAYTMATGSATPFVAAILAFLVGFYSVGARADPGPAVAALVVGLTGFWLQDLRLHHPFSEYVASAVLVIGPWTAGRALRALRAQNSRLRHLTRELEREREARARDAVLAERARLATEMHDAIGHSLSVISLQAQAAEAALPRDPARVREPLAAIEQATRTAMADMRRLVNVLDEGPGLTAPLPTIADLAALAEDHRSSGLEVALDLEAPPLELSSAVHLAAYRIVQEGLTNVRRHSRSTQARVAVRFEAEVARIEVADDGPAREPSPLGVPTGRGLVGVRTRAVSCGGSVHAGPHGRGWTVRADLPFDAAPTP